VSAALYKFADDDIMTPLSTKQGGCGQFEAPGEFILPWCATRARVATALPKCGHHDPVYQPRTEPNHVDEPHHAIDAPLHAMD
jgi:hypothetical protein